ncbi:lytic transglycosylase domain-containing protein [Burkholderia stagnalis]|uniref:lytic transglycosylase domain-containing protein n=1 Tax=Burkholderia stagnalis TaxID=1503054 RepID=UPI0007555C8A|nr:lytic transglycosylase domain-containing protein [Burkholderia stagnalis]KVN27843.1 lytic transglycosylase [Burkholderia stagnalis]RQQ53545.1 lytic transglycosylase [Burkholderia stagnalis]RQY04787.1 lytic transglycosylase [Burkholderia stagnalis]RQY21128.1 lytic transglycosylase [Burkholderia stagnalis]RQY33141.1 lytic transglycosylase [Burkholderia stagnalis]
MRTLSTACKGLRRSVAAVALFATCASGAAAKDCFTKAGERHGIDPLLLAAVAKVESALNPRAMNWNRNGTYDIGLMQINSSHLPRLIKAGVTHKRLIDEPCTSIDTGASILAGFIDRHGYTWNAVGAYNAGSAPKREPARKAYATKVWREYRALTSDRDASLAMLDEWRR